MLNAFDPHFLPFQPGQPVIAAFSGGSDSTALLLTLDDFLKRRHPETRLKAITVDHGLRAGSAAEANAAAALCARLGIDHDILNWTGPKPLTGISAAARAARYRLLAQAAGRDGVIVTGHTLNDQAETIAMRQVRGKGRGLAGMADATLFDGRTWILRPFLGVSRASLQQMLQNTGIGWSDDPGNANLRAERIAIRVRIEAEGEAALMARVGGIAAAQAERLRLSQAAAALAAKHLTMPEPGLYRLDADFQPADPAGIFLLRAVAAMAGGAEFLLSEDLAGPLAERLADTAAMRTALGGAVAEKRREGLFLHREWRGSGLDNRVSDGIWDGRFRVAAGASPAASGHGGRAKGAGRLSGGARDAEPDLPGLLRLVSPWARFLPGFDHGLAQTMARIAGAEIPSDLPYAGHDERERS